MHEIIRCKRCVMDNASDNTITFDKNGYCNYCNNAYKQKGLLYFPNEEGTRKLEEQLTKIKATGVGKKYDCIMGLSGGLDSSYLAYLGYKWGLRVLAVHIDDGYDTDISKNNLKKLIAATGFDYEVIAPDSEQFNALTLAYLRAGVPNVAIPQDNILLAFLYSKMKENRIKYFLTGGNFALECILQKGNSYKSSDVVNIIDINKNFGKLPVDKLKFISTMQMEIDRRILGIKTPRLLNLVDYNRNRAFTELKDFCDFEYYGRKHLENILTAFIQLYWFPKKFGVDKRTSHLSSMIISDQMTREEALNELKKPLYDESLMNSYIKIIKQYLRISDEEFEKIMNAPTHQHSEFKIEDNEWYYKLLRFVHHLIS